jgi:hypothetical protein
LESVGKVQHVFVTIQIKTIKIPAQGNFPVLKESFLSQTSLSFYATRREEENAAFDIHHLRANFAWVGRWRRKLSNHATVQNCGWGGGGYQGKNDGFLAPPTQANYLSLPS